MNSGPSRISGEGAARFCRLPPERSGSSGRSERRRSPGAGTGQSSGTTCISTRHGEFSLSLSTAGHDVWPSKTLDEYLPLRVSGVTFCAKTEDLPARSPETAAGWAAWLRALASTMAQKRRPASRRCSRRRARAAVLAIFAQPDGGAEPICTTPRRQRTGIINAYLLAGLPQSEYNRRDSHD